MKECLLALVRHQNTIVPGAVLKKKKADPVLKNVQYEHTARDMLIYRLVDGGAQGNKGVVFIRIGSGLCTLTA